MTTQTSINRRHEYQQKVQAELNKLNAQITEYRAKAEQSKAEISVKYHSHLEQLMAKQEAVESKLAQLQQSGSEAWDELQQGFEQAWADLNQAFQNAASAFERS